MTERLLTDQQAGELKWLYESTAGLPQGHRDRWSFKKLADQYRVSANVVWKIIHRQTYTEIEPRKPHGRP